MIFEWDPAKAAANFAKHDVTFDFATRVFRDPAHIVVDASSSDDPEPRDMAIGMIHGALHAVVHVNRNDVCRIISARAATPREGRLYANG